MYLFFFLKYIYKNCLCFKNKIKWYLKNKPMIKYSGFNCGLCGKWVNKEFEIPEYDSKKWQVDTWGICEECSFIRFDFKILKKEMKNFAEDLIIFNICDLSFFEKIIYKYKIKNILNMLLLKNILYSKNIDDLKFCIKKADIIGLKRFFETFSQLIYGDKYGRSWSGKNI